MYILLKEGTMKKTLSLAVLAVLFLAGCASTGTGTTASAANTPLTLEEALQKSAETRQKLEEAKQAYQNAKAAATASQQNGTSITTELAKQAIQSQINTATTQVNNEIQAWKDVVKN